MPNFPFSIVLVAPDIPGNTGSIGRTCVALNLRLILIRPYGFDLSEKSLRRAGLDYWKHINLTEYDSLEEFFNREDPKDEELFLYSKTVSQNFYQANYETGGYLIFGAETTGLPSSFLKKFSKRVYSLPMYGEFVRSLNLANAATAVAYQAIAHLH